MTEFRIVLPPQGSLLREYLKTALYYADPVELRIQTKEGSILHAKNIRNAISSAVSLATQIISDENKKRKENDVGEVKFPLTGNDSRHTIGNIMKFFSLKKKDPLEKLFAGYADYLIKECTEDDLQKAFGVFDKGYPNDCSLTLRAAALSIFKAEHYERVRSLGYYASKNEIALGIHSTILGMVGYILSKIGIVETRKKDYVSVLITPEDLSKRVEVLDITRHIDGMQKMRGERVPGVDPPQALLLWLGTVWRNNQRLNNRPLLNVFLIKEPSRTRKSSSMYGQMTVDVTRAMALADGMNEYALRNYKWLLRSALRYDSDKKDFAVLITKKIWQVLDHSITSDELVYFASREALKMESSNNDDKKFYNNASKVSISIQKVLESIK